MMRIVSFVAVCALALGLQSPGFAAEAQTDEDKAAEDYFKNLDANWAKDAAAAQKACDAGDMKGCVELGRAYSTGKGVKQDGPKALAIQTKACAAGEMNGCFSAGVMLYLGKVVAKDAAKAGVFLEKACKAGTNDACFNLYAVYSNQTPAELQAACDRGAVRACDKLGMRLVNGNGVAQDKKKAVQLFAFACKGGEMVSCESLGAMTLTGDGAAKDPQQALQLLRQACDHKRPSACDKIGVVYEGKFGIAADKVKSAAAYDKACAGDDVASCSAAGRNYLLGSGVPVTNRRPLCFSQKPARAMSPAVVSRSP